MSKNFLGLIIAFVVLLVVSFFMYQKWGGDMNVPTDNLNTSSESGEVVRGEVVAKDLSMAAVDGPFVIYIVTEDGRDQIIHVSSMGLLLCEASDNIENIENIKVGDIIEVNGEIDGAGNIVPCASSAHYLKIIAR